MVGGVLLESLRANLAPRREALAVRDAQGGHTAMAAMRPVLTGGRRHRRHISSASRYADELRRPRRAGGLAGAPRPSGGANPIAEGWGHTLAPSGGGVWQGPASAAARVCSNCSAAVSWRRRAAPEPLRPRGVLSTVVLPPAWRPPPPLAGDTAGGTSRTACWPDQQGVAGRRRVLAGFADALAPGGAPWVGKSGRPSPRCRRRTTARRAWTDLRVCSSSVAARARGSAEPSRTAPSVALTVSARVLEAVCRPRVQATGQRCSPRRGRAARGVGVASVPSQRQSRMDMASAHAEAESQWLHRAGV